MNATRTIILLFESSCEYGREFLKGVAQFARERRNWHLRLYPLSVADAKNPFDGCDGIIARVKGRHVKTIGGNGTMEQGPTVL